MLRLEIHAKATGLDNDTTRLRGLAGVAVTRVELDERDNPMLALVTVDEAARRCPGCGMFSISPHSWVTTRPRDLLVAARPCQLRWNKRRWRCRNPACTRETFTESIPQIQAVEPRHASGERSVMSLVWRG